MVTQVSSSLNALSFTCVFYFTVLDSSGATTIISTFRHREGGRSGRERLISSFKDISQKSHDTFLFTTHWTALSHLATSGSKKLRNVDFIPDNYLPRHTSEIPLLKKKSKRYIESVLAVSATGGTMNSTGVQLKRRKFEHNLRHN